MRTELDVEIATLDPASRRLRFPADRELILTDTVGFIRKLPHGLVASFQATQEEVAEADLLIHVIDASSPSWDHQVEAVEEVLHEIGASGHPTVLAFNKVDQLTHTEEDALRLRAADLFGPHVLTSTRETDGLASLKGALRTRVRAERRAFERILDEINYRYWDETENRAYQLYLGQREG